jgi:hypothetical protein
MNNSILFLVILVTVLVTILTYAGVSLFGDIPSIFRPFFDINYKFLSLLYRRSRCQINNKVFYDQLLPLLRLNNPDLWEVHEKDSEKVRLAKSYVNIVLNRQVLFDKYFQNYAYSYEKHKQLMAELQGEEMAATSRFEIAFAIMIKAFPGEEEFIKDFIRVQQIYLNATRSSDLGKGWDAVNANKFLSLTYPQRAGVLYNIIKCKCKIDIPQVAYAKFCASVSLNDDQVSQGQISSYASSYDKEPFNDILSKKLCVFSKITSE